MDLAEAATQLVSVFGLTSEEAEAYITLIKNGRLSKNELGSLTTVAHDRLEDVVEKLMARGFTIRESGVLGKIVPLHPRMTTTNAFKALQDNLMQQMKEKRKIADRLALALSAVYEETLGMDPMKKRD